MRELTPQERDQTLIMILRNQAMVLRALDKLSSAAWAHPERDEFQRLAEATQQWIDKTSGSK
jgi:hypothetical protein